MKVLLTLLVSLAASNAFAVDFDCNNGFNDDRFNSVSLQNDVFTVQFWETHYEFSDSEFFNQESQSTGKSGQPDTNITFVKDLQTTVHVEGDTQQVTVTAVFVYNPEQKAGRLTFISDGDTVARNRLFEVCN